MKKFTPILLAVCCLFSCATKKEILYFQDAEKLNSQETAQYFDPKIEPNDILYISVSAFDEEVLKPYRRSVSTQTASQDDQLQGFLVGSDGNIQYPGLGTVSVVGNTRTEVIVSLTAKLSQFVKDVVVDVRIINFKITVLGEVKTPGVYVIKDERVTIPQAIGLAGDFTADGKRETVTIIREENGSQKVTKVDFTKTEFFSSPYYFLKQNDIVYVEPSLKGVKKSGFIPDIPAVLSVVTIALTAVILITR